MTTLYLMVGYPGAGKTTVAQHIADITGAEHIWADHERTERFSSPTFSQAENDELYESLNARTAELLANGKNVVFDTAFNHLADREKLRNIATQQGAQTIVVWVKTAREIAEQRALEADGRTPTRKLDHHMTEADFHRLSDKLEEPRSDENVMVIDGTAVTSESIKSALTAHATTT